VISSLREASKTAKSQGSSWPRRRLAVWVVVGALLGGARLALTWAFPLPSAATRIGGLVLTLALLALAASASLRVARHDGRPGWTAFAIGFAYALPASLGRLFLHETPQQVQRLLGYRTLPGFTPAQLAHLANLPAVRVTGFLVSWVLLTLLGTAIGSLAAYLGGSLTSNSRV
jgi:hypothetical protein